MSKRLTQQMKSKYINKHVIVRANRAGVFAGTLKAKDGSEVILTNARRLWQWAGAASLSQLAMEGVKLPSESKFTMLVDEITILEVIELIPTTKAAQENINAVPVWKK